MSHDPFAGRRNARRRATNPAPTSRTDAVPGLADEMLAWIDQASEPGERRQRAKLVIEAEKQSASPRSEVMAAARAVLSQRPPAGSGAKRRAAEPPPPSPRPAEPESPPASEPEPVVEPVVVPEKAREIVAWLRASATPDEAKERGEAARAAEMERLGRVRASVQAEIDKVL